MNAKKAKTLRRIAKKYCQIHRYSTKTEYREIEQQSPKRHPVFQDVVYHPKTRRVDPTCLRGVYRELKIVQKFSDLDPVR